MRLKYQLFFTLLTASAVLIAVMWLINSWTFSRGFLEYQNNAIRARLQTLSVELAERYEQEGHWEWVNRRNLATPLQTRRRVDTNRSSTSSTSDNEERSDTHSEDVESERLKQPPAEQVAAVSPPGSERPRRGGRFRSFVLLADKDRNLLVGRKEAHDVVLWEPISLDQETIGYVGARELRRSGSLFERAFERQQKRSFFYAALGMILISALMAIPLASRIVRPLLSVNRAVGEISQGNYTHRVAVDRKDELGDLSRSINSLGLSLEKNLQARQRWIAEISHELRTPIAVLQAELEAMQDGVRERDENAIDSLHTEILQLSTLVNDLHTLSMSDIGALDYVMEPVSLQAIVAEQISANHQLLDESSLTVSINSPSGTDDNKLLVNADVKRLRQLVANLLQNSMRYTDTDQELPARLDIHLYTEHVGSERVVGLTWSDSAPGVEPEALEKLFEPLFRGEASRNRQYGGAGLGLAIVRRIVEAHQGSVTAAPSALGGLMIRVELPAYESTGYQRGIG